MKTNKEYEKLLALCHEISKDPKVKFNDLRMASPHVEKLAMILKKAQRYEWVKVGECLYLYPMKSSRSENPRALIVKVKTKHYQWKIMGAHFVGRSNEGTCSSEASAKKQVETFFVVAPEKE